MGSIIEVNAASKMKSNVIKIQYAKMCGFKMYFKTLWDFCMRKVIIACVTVW